MLTSLVKVATCHVIIAAIFGVCKTTWSVPQGSRLDRLLLRLTVCHRMTTAGDRVRGLTLLNDGWCSRKGDGA